MTIGERIKETRIKIGMSQVMFADRIGVSKQTLYKYENGIISNIPSDKIFAIAKVGNVSPSYLMGWSDNSDERSGDSARETGWYLNPETAKVAQELHDDPDLRVLFDAARDSRPEDLQMAADLLRRLKDTNPEG